MSSRIVVAMFLSILLSSTAAAEPASSDPAGAQATVPHVESIGDVKIYLERTRNVIALARSGGYGPIKKQDMDRAVAAQAQIESLLSSRNNAADLTNVQQLDLANAQETINSIIRSDQKGRLVCKQVPVTGSRLATKECLTVAEREARATQARETAHDLQINLGCARDPSTGRCL